MICPSCRGKSHSVDRDKEEYYCPNCKVLFHPQTLPPMQVPRSVPYLPVPAELVGEIERIGNNHIETEKTPPALPEIIEPPEKHELIETDDEEEEGEDISPEERDLIACSPLEPVFDTSGFEDD